MDINELFSLRRYEADLGGIENDLYRATGTVTWYGRRVIQIDGVEGVADINNVAINAFRVAESDTRSREDRLHGLAISRRLAHLYYDSATALRNANWFARFVNFFLEFNFFNPYTPEFFVCDGDLWHRFGSISIEKYRERFGEEAERRDPEVPLRYPHAVGSYGPPLRIVLEVRAFE